MPRHLTDEEDLYYRGQDRKAQFADSLFNDPKLNPMMKWAIKQKYPNLPIPGYDEAMQVKQMFDYEKKKRDDEEATKKAETEKQDWINKKTAAQKKYGLTEEGMKEVEDLMHKENTWSYETAAGYLVSKKPKPSVPTYDSQYWHFEKKPDWEEKMKDPDAWARNQFEQAARRDEERLRNQSF